MYFSCSIDAERSVKLPPNTLCPLPFSFLPFLPPSRWAGAAVTSTSRLWLPLTTLRVHSSAGPSRSVSFDCGPESLAWKIQKVVERKYEEQCEEL